NVADMECAAPQWGAWLMRLGILLVLAVFCVSPACAEDLGNPVTGEAKTAFLTTWGERLRSMRSLHMFFTQEKHRGSCARLWLRRENSGLKGRCSSTYLLTPRGKKN